MEVMSFFFETHMVFWGKRRIFSLSFFRMAKAAAAAAAAGVVVVVVGRIFFLLIFLIFFFFNVGVI